MNNQPPINPYHILNVDKSAQQDEIKKAWKSAAQKLHPDNQDTGDSDQYCLVAEAYDVIGNPVRRKHYDETGLTEMLPPVEERVDDALASLANQVIMKILNPQPVIDPITRQPRPSNLDFNVDIVQACKEQVKNDIRTLSVTDQGLQEAIAMIEVLQSRVSTTAKNNVVEAVLEEKIRRMTHQFNMNADTHALFNAIEKRLDLYSDKQGLLQ